MANGELTLQDAFKNILDLSTSFIDLKSIDMSKLYEVSTKSYDYYSNFKDLSDASKKYKSDTKTKKTKRTKKL
jgi:hypothetical protein